MICLSMQRLGQTKGGEGGRERGEGGRRRRRGGNPEAGGEERVDRERRGSLLWGFGPPRCSVLRCYSAACLCVGLLLARTKQRSGESGGNWGLRCV